VNGQPSLAKKKLDTELTTGAVRTVHFMISLSETVCWQEFPRFWVVV